MDPLRQELSAITQRVDRLASVRDRSPSQSPHGRPAGLQTTPERAAGGGLVSPTAALTRQIMSDGDQELSQEGKERAARVLSRFFPGVAPGSPDAGGAVVDVSLEDPPTSAQDWAFWKTKLDTQNETLRQYQAKLRRARGEVREEREGARALQAQVEQLKRRCAVLTNELDRKAEERQAQGDGGTPGGSVPVSPRIMTGGAASEIEMHTQLNAAIHKVRVLQEKLEVERMAKAELQQAKAREQQRNADLVDEVEQLREAKKSLEDSNNQLMSELEDLTQALFEESNKLVATEARARHASEVRQQELQLQLEAMRVHAQQMEQDLDAAEWQVEHERSLRVSAVMSRDEPLPPPDTPPRHHKAGANEWSCLVAPLLRSEFEAFVWADDQTGKQFVSAAFMRRIMREDIEPCVFVLARSRKSLITGLLGRQISLELESGAAALGSGGGDGGGGGGGSSSSNSVSRSAAKRKKCSVCGAEEAPVCTYKIVLGGRSSEDPCCRFCRERVHAAIELHAYLRQIYGILERQRAEVDDQVPSPTGKVTSEDFFKECARLRRKLCTARLSLVA